MLESLSKIWKYLINLTPEKRSTALMLALNFLFGYIAFYSYKVNESRSNQDNMRIIKYQHESDSLLNEVFKAKLETANRELIYVKELSNKIEIAKEQILLKVNKIEKQQKLIKRNKK